MLRKTFWPLALVHRAATCCKNGRYVPVARRLMPDEAVLVPQSSLVVERSTVVTEENAGKVQLMKRGGREKKGRH